MQLPTTEPPNDHAGAWIFLRERFHDASKAWADSDPTLSVLCDCFAEMMKQRRSDRERIISDMDEAIRHHWLGFGQLAVGMASYNVIWNSSAAYRDASRSSVQEVSDDPDQLPGTDLLLEEEMDLVKSLPKALPQDSRIERSVDLKVGKTPIGIEQGAAYTSARLNELVRYWNRTIPWLAHICDQFVSILSLPHRDREKAFLELDNSPKFRLTGAIMLVGGNGLVASVLYPTLERYQTDPLAAGIPRDFLEDRNARVAEHFLRREEWVNARRGK